jgi:outer membrane protein OmpU
MTNLKKLGLTALAGSLVATSGFAGEMSVSGTAKVSYTSGDTLSVTGNPFSASNAISFSGGGELDNGMNVSVSIATDTGSSTFSSSNLVLDMGDAGKFAVSKEMSSGHGYNAYQDKMPTAGEEVWDDMSGEANGRVGMEDNGTISYGNAVGGANFSVAYNKDSAGANGSDKSIAVDYAPIDGLMVFVARADISSGTTVVTDKHTTFGGTYTAMGATVGMQKTSLAKNAANSDVDRTHIAASFAVNESLSVSYGMSTVEFETAGSVDQEDSGFAASYTMGSMSFSASSNKSDNAGGTSGNDDTHKEISVAFAF